MNAKGFPNRSAFLVLPVPEYLLAFFLDNKSEEGKGPSRAQKREEA